MKTAGSVLVAAFLAAIPLMAAPQLASGVASIAALRELPLPISNGSVQRTLGYYHAKDGGGATFRWNATSALPDDGGSIIKPTAAQNGGRWISTTRPHIADVRQWGVKADGVTDDANAIARALAWLAKTSVPKELILPAGTMAILSSQADSTFGTHNESTFHYQGRSAVWSLAALSGDLTIRGAGKDKTKLSQPVPRTMWDCYLGPQNLDLVLRDFTMEYTGGNRPEPVSHYAAGIVCAATPNGSHVNSLRVVRCGLNNFMPAIVGPFKAVRFEVDRSEFLYQYGRASYSCAPEDNSPGAAILDGCSGSNVFTNNVFNGLVDPTYTGVNPGLAAKQLVPVDNFIHNFLGGAHVVTGNRIYNNNIEGVLIGTWPIGDPKAANREARVRILNNVFCGTAPQSPAYYYGTRPGIKIANRQDVLISGNTISNQAIGIELVGTGRHVVAEKNRIVGSFNGIFLVDCDGSIVRDNYYRAQTEATAAEKAAGFTHGRFGVYAHHSTRNSLIENNTIDGVKEEGWHITSVVAPQREPTRNTASRVYLTSVVGWEITHWAYLNKAKPDGIFHHAPVTAIGPDYIDIDPGWAAYGGVPFGQAAVAGDRVVSTGNVSSIGGDGSTSAGIFIRGGSDGSNNRVINNTIINHLNGLDRFRFSQGESAADLLEFGNKFRNVGAERGEGTGAKAASTRIGKDATRIRIREKAKR